jgi:hypothetical protein
MTFDLPLQIIFECVPFGKGFSVNLALWKRLSVNLPLWKRGLKGDFSIFIVSFSFRKIPLNLPLRKGEVG